MLVAAFDPGRNIGFALVDGEGKLLRSELLDAAGIAHLGLPPVAVVVVGDGTGSVDLVQRLVALGLEPVVVDEAGTSLEGRSLFFRDHPPRAPWRWLPRGLWVAPREIDDYAAYAIALRFLHGGVGKKSGRT